MTYPTFSQRDRHNFSSLRMSRFRPRHLSWVALGVVLVGGVALFGFSSPDAVANRPVSQALPLAIPGTPPGVTAQALPDGLPRADIAAMESQDGAAAPADNQVAVAVPALEAQSATGEAVATASAEIGTWMQAKVQRGDSLARIFSRSGINARDLHDIMTLGAAVNTLKRIHPGQTLHLRAEAGRLLELRYEESQTLGLSVTREDDKFIATTIHRIPDRQTAHASATIDSSLFMAGQKAKLSDTMIMDLAGIFGWDIDFALDIREGDRFTVLYDELYLDGERIGEGNILAAEFVNQGQIFRAIRYTDADGRTDYYTPEGHSMRKAFLKTPVEFSRISSGFNLKRKHPVLNRIRAHKGVDYAAPTGTPIKTTGDGRVTFRGVKGGYGNVVIVQHGSAYSTLYAHMSKFAKGVNVGTRVRQGQTIGYIGMSGLATGPHLHYEFLVNGVHRNPLKVKFPDAAPIDKRFQADFNKTAQELLARLELVRDRSTQVALNER